MKINKITSHFLKRIKKGWDIRYCQYDEKYLITDGYKLFLLNEDEVQFNLSLATKVNSLAETWEDAIKADVRLNYKLSKKDCAGLDLVNKYQNEDSTITTYINDEYLKFFKLEECYLYTKREKEASLVVIKEGEKAVGVVSPINLERDAKF